MSQGGTSALLKRLPSARGSLSLPSQEVVSPQMVLSGYGSSRRMMPGSTAKSDTDPWLPQCSIFPCQHHLALTAQVALKGLVSNMRAPWRAQLLRRPSPQNGRGGDALWQKNVGFAAASRAAVSTARGLTSRSSASDAASTDWEDIGATGGRFALPTTCASASGEPLGWRAGFQKCGSARAPTHK